MTPPLLERTVRKCLAKEPENRWQSAKDLHDDLEWIAGGGSEAGVSEPVAAAPVSRVKRALTVGLSVLLGAVVTGVAVWSLMRPGPEAPVRQTRLGITLPTDQRLTELVRNVVALSPDGAHLVYAANNQLYLRTMDQMEATPIGGTGGTFSDRSSAPFFSPDGQWVGFHTATQLKKSFQQRRCTSDLVRRHCPIRHQLGAR